MHRILHWTGGHPYLTQRLCRAVVEAKTVTDAPGVDGLCEDLFLSPRARERDDNLLFVRERLLRSDVDRSGLLDLYARVWRGKRVPDDETNPLVSALHLSGITRAVEGSLQPRNRIYARVFDRAWVMANMPDAELLRQRAAYRRGLLRAGLVSAGIVAAMGGLVLTAVRQARRAEQATRREASERQRAQEGQQALRRHLYATQTNLAAQALEANNVPRALDLLTRQRPKPGEEDLRGFEWRLLWHLIHRNEARATIVMSVLGRAVAFSPDGTLLATGGATVKLWDVATRRTLDVLVGHTGFTDAFAFSADGQFLATGSADATIRLWSLKTRQEVAVLRGHRGRVGALAFSPDGNALASAADDWTVRLWSTAPSEQDYLKGRHDGVRSVAVSTQGKVLATGGENGVKLWDLATGQAIRPVPGYVADTYRLAISPDGRTLAAGCRDQSVTVWDVPTRRRLVRLPLKNRPDFQPVALSPGGHTLAFSDQYTIRLWDRNTRQEGALPRVFREGEHGMVNSLAFSPDGALLASGAAGNPTVKLWDVPERRLLHTFTGYTFFSAAPAFSPDGRLLATHDGPDHGLRVWDVPTKRLILASGLFSKNISPIGFSPGGKTLITSSSDGTIRLWNVASWQEAATFRDPLLVAPAVAIAPDVLITGRVNGQVRLWRATPLSQADAEERDALHLITTVAGGTVTLTWQPVPDAVGYHVYRGAPGATLQALIRGAPQRVSGTTVTDRTPVGAGGRGQSYAVAALFGRGGQPETEGSRAAAQVNPVVAPPGWLGASIDERGGAGAVAWSPRDGVMTLRGAGVERWSATDGLYFAGQPLEGDVQFTVRALARPTDTDPFARAGVMIREGLAPDARMIGLFITSESGLVFHWRPDRGRGLPPATVLPDDAPQLSPPATLHLRLRRRGDEVRAEYSTDGGRSFRPATEPRRFDPPLQPPLYVGLAISSHNPGQISEAKFRDLRFETLAMR